MQIRITPPKNVKSVTLINYFNHLPIHDTFECHILYKRINEYVVYVLPLKYQDDPHYVEHEGLVKTVFHLKSTESVSECPF